MTIKNPGDVSEQEILSTPWPDKEIDKKRCLDIIRIYGWMNEQSNEVIFNDIYCYYENKYPERVAYIYYMKFVYDFLKPVLGSPQTAE